jgi:hypothetical protein
LNALNFRDLDILFNVRVIDLGKIQHLHEGLDHILVHAFRDGPELGGRLLLCECRLKVCIRDKPPLLIDPEDDDPEAPAQPQAAASVRGQRWPRLWRDQRLCTSVLGLLCLTPGRRAAVEWHLSAGGHSQAPELRTEVHSQVGLYKVR